MNHFGTFTCKPTGDGKAYWIASRLDHLPWPKNTPDQLCFPRPHTAHWTDLGDIAPAVENEFQGSGRIVFITTKPAHVPLWDSDHFAHLFDRAPGIRKIAHGRLFVVEPDIDGFFFAIEDVQSKPLRVRPIEIQWTPTGSRLVSAEIGLYGEDARFDRQTVGWDEVTKLQKAGRNDEALEAARRIFYTFMNHTLENAILQDEADPLLELARSGDFTPVADKQRPVKFLKGDEAELHKVIAAALAVTGLQHSVPVNVHVRCESVFSTRNERSRRIDLEERDAAWKSIPRTRMRNLHEFLKREVGTYFAPSGDTLHLKRGDASPRILSNYTRSIRYLNIQVPPPTGHERIGAVRTLESWLVRRAGRSAAAAAVEIRKLTE